MSFGTRSCDLLGNAQLGKIDRRRVQAAAHGDHHVLLGDIMLVGQELQQPATLLLLQLHRLRELRGQQQTVLDEDIRDAFAERFDAHEQKIRRVEPPSSRVARRYVRKHLRIAAGDARCHWML